MCIFNYTDVLKMLSSGRVKEYIFLKWDTCSKNYTQFPIIGFMFKRTNLSNIHYIQNYH